MIKKIMMLFCLAMLSLGATAQKRTVTLVNLREAENKPFFNQDHELPQLVFEAAESGKIKLYDVDYLNNATVSVLSPEHFKQRMTMPFEQEGFQEGEAQAQAEPQYFFYRQASLIGIDEITDDASQPSAIQYINFYIPEGLLPTRLMRYIGSVAYNDFEALMRQDKRAVWHNRDLGGYLSFGDVFQFNIDEETPTALIMQLLRAAEEGQITAFYGEKKNPFPAAQLKASLHRLNTADAWRYTVRVKEEAVTENGQTYYVPRELRIIDEGTEKNDYKVNYIASFDVEEVRKLKTNSLWLPPSQNQLMNFASALQAKKYKADKVVYEKPSKKAPAEETTLVQATKTAEDRYQKMTASEVDLREKANAFLMKNRKEFSRILIEGVLKGRITPYEIQPGYNANNEPRTAEMSKNEFLQKLKLPEINTEMADQLGLQATPAAKPMKTRKDKLYKGIEGNYFLPGQLTSAEVRESMYFDAQGLHKQYQPTYIGIVIPGTYLPSGLNQAVAYFRYDDVVNLMKKDRRARYRNASRKKKNYGEAFGSRDYEATTWFTSPASSGR